MKTTQLTELLRKYDSAIMGISSLIDDDAFIALGYYGMPSYNGGTAYIDKTDSPWMYNESSEELTCYNSLKDIGTGNACQYKICDLLSNKTDMTIGVIVATQFCACVLLDPNNEVSSKVYEAITKGNQ